MSTQNDGRAKISTVGIFVDIPSSHPQKHGLSQAVKIMRLAALLRDGLIFSAGDNQVTTEEQAVASAQNTETLSKTVQSASIIALAAELGIDL